MIISLHLNYFRISIVYTRRRNRLNNSRYSTFFLKELPVLVSCLEMVQEFLGNFCRQSPQLSVLSSWPKRVPHWYRQLNRKFSVQFSPVFSLFSCFLSLKKETESYSRLLIESFMKFTLKVVTWKCVCFQSQLWSKKNNRNFFYHRIDCS